jgi:multidrug efflux system outer membrane protein
MFSKKYILSFTIVLITIFSCKVPKYVAVSAPTFQAQGFDSMGTLISDSVSIGATSWKSIFKDEYLKNLISVALQNNNSLLAFDQKIAISSANLLVAKNLTKPSLNANVQTNFDRYGFYTMNGVGNYDLNKSSNITPSQRVPTALTPDLFTGFRSSWEVDVWGQLKTKKRVAEYDVEAQKWEKHLLNTEVVTSIATLYYQLLAFDEEYLMLQNAIVIQKEGLDIVRIQKEAGRANELAVQQFEAQYLGTQALQYQVKQSIVAIENELSFLCGTMQQKIVRSASLGSKMQPFNLTVGNVEMLTINRPDIQKIEVQLAASKANINIARLAYYPSFNFNPYFGLSSFSISKIIDPSSVAFGLLGGVQLPIFTKKQNEANWLIAQSNNKELYYQYKQAMLKAIAEVQTQLGAVENVSNELALKDQQAQILKSAIGTADNLYAAGQANYLEVLTTRKNALDAAIEAITIKGNLFVEAIKMYKALGGGWR